MTACEAGQTNVIEMIFAETYEKHQHISHFEYTCESGSPLHAAITGERPLDTTQCLIERYEEFSVDEDDPDYVENSVNRKDLS